MDPIIKDILVWTAAIEGCVYVAKGCYYLAYRKLLNERPEAEKYFLRTIKLPTPFELIKWYKDVKKLAAHLNSLKEQGFSENTEDIMYNNYISQL